VLREGQRHLRVALSFFVDQTPHSVAMATSNGRIGVKVLRSALLFDSFP
jgi:hypothetical protein